MKYKDLFSSRARTLNGAEAHLVPYYMRMMDNKYDEKTNPNGIVNMGVAENMLCETEIVNKLNTIQKWLAPMNYYGHPVGELSLRIEVCQFFQEHLQIEKQKLTPDRVIITSGASGGFIVYTYLLAEPEDVILIASPYYTMIDHHVSVLTSNQIFRCPLLEQDTDKFRLSVEIFERGYNEAIDQGLRPRIIILINPHNPLGDVYDEATVRPILEFAAKKQLHVIVDEIYALSMFSTQKRFQSILNYDLPDPARTHFVWSFSKDFAISGAHVGVMYAGVSELCSLANGFNFLLVPSRSVQATLASMLADREWIRSYIELSRTRLSQQYRRIKAEFELMGIRVHEGHAGFFVWADLRAFMDEITFEEEDRLFDHLFNCGLFVSSGYSMACSQPGWFRFVFSLTETLLVEGLKRLKNALMQLRK